jgi:RNA polymerase sigma-70 factor, ECF subfamily
MTSRAHNGPVTSERDPFVAVYTQHLGAVSAYLARRVDRGAVDDLAADVFAIAWRKRDKVATGEELPWLYRIASYVVSNHRRQLASRTSVLARLTAHDSAPSAEDIVVADRALAEAWRALSARDREVLALGVVEGLGASEVGTALGISANAASIRLHRARTRLSELLGNISEPG